MDEEGVSAVIGAVLVFGLITSAFFMFTVTTLPVWIADNENSRISEARDALIDFSEASSSSTPGGKTITQIPMSAQEVPLLQPAKSMASIGVGGSNDVTMTIGGANRLLQESNIIGTPNLALNGLSITDFTSISQGKMQVSLTGIQNNDVLTGSLTITSPSLNYVLGLRASGKNGATSCDSSEFSMSITLDGVLTPNTKLQCFGTDLSLAIDLTGPEAKLASSFPASEGPYNLVGSSAIAANLAFSIRDANGAAVVMGTTGTPLAGPITDQAGYIKYEPLNYHAKDTSIFLEYGNLLIEQGDGSAVTNLGGFKFAGTTASPILDISQFNWSPDSSISGSGSIGARVSRLGSSEIVFSAATFAFDGTSGNPAAHASFLTNLVADAGLSGEFNITSDADSFSIAYTPSVPGATVQIRYASTDVDVEFR